MGSKRTTDKRNKNPRPGADDRNEILANQLADAVFFGHEYACKKHDITDRSMRRYKARMVADTKLGALVAEGVRKRNLEATSWAVLREQALKTIGAKLVELCDKATVDHIREVAGALKIYGDLHVVSGALSGEFAPAPATGQGGAAPPAASGGSGTPHRSDTNGTNGVGPGATAH